MTNFYPANILHLSIDSIIGKSFEDKKESFYISYLEGETNNNLQIIRDCDGIKITHIEFENNTNITDLLNLNIYIRGNLIWKFDLELLIKNLSFKKNILYLPNDLLFMNNDFLYICSVMYCDVYIEITSKNKFKYKIYFIKQILDTKDRTEKITNSLEYKINDNKIKKIEDKKVDVKDMRSIKGFYIIGSKIKQIKFIINNRFEFFNYDHKMIKLFGSVKKTWIYKNEIKKFLRYSCVLLNIPKELIIIIESYISNEYLYWIPFGTNEHNNYLDICRLDSAIIDFNETYYGKIIGLTRNILMTMNGLGGVKFSH